MMICASKESDLEGKAGQKRLHIYVVIALVLLPIITLAYNIISPPIDGSTCSDWRNCSICSAVTYSVICLYGIIASIIPCLICIIVLLKLLINKYREKWVYLLYMIPLFILVILFFIEYVISIQSAELP